MLMRKAMLVSGLGAASDVGCVTSLLSAGCLYDTVREVEKVSTLGTAASECKDPGLSS